MYMKIYNQLAHTKKVLLALVGIILVLSACKKIYDLPEDKDYLSNDANYSVSIVRGIIGRTTLFSSIFNGDNSNYPIKFQITNVKNLSGTASDALTKVKKVLVWQNAYTGFEKSLAEINAKRVLEDHPIFEVRSSGEFILWSSSKNEDLLKPLPDSLYTFNVKISNGGGERTLGPIRFIPIRERAYEPSYQINQNTGEALKEVNGQVKRLIPATLTNMRGAATGRNLVREQIGPPLVQDVWVYFKRVGNGSSLTFKFMNKDSLAIDPKKFNGTKWTEIVHGFDDNGQPGPVFTTTSVRYNLAYPIPLTKLSTKYTTIDGSQAVVNFSYNRIGFGGLREVGAMGLNFNIFQEGDWEIIFFFHNETPKFEDE